MLAPATFVTTRHPARQSWPDARRLARPGAREPGPGGELARGLWREYGQRALPHLIGRIRPAGTSGGAWPPTLHARRAGKCAFCQERAYRAHAMCVRAHDRRSAGVAFWRHSSHDPSWWLGDCWVAADGVSPADVIGGTSGPESRREIFSARFLLCWLRSGVAGGLVAAG